MASLLLTGLRVKLSRGSAGLALMETNIVNEEYFEDELPLGEPHFDEEATLLSARPVVPLQEIKAEEQSRKRLIVGLAMACSLMMGALVATLVYKRSGQAQSAAISTAVPGAAGIAVDDPISPPATQEVGGGATGALTPGDATSVEKKSAPSVSRSAESIAVESQQKKNLPQQLDEQDLSRDERIEARRLRRRLERQTRRESSGRSRRTSDDLLRIRDIFEGPSRP